MSAYIVSKAHIDLMVKLVLEGPMKTPGMATYNNWDTHYLNPYKVHSMSANDIGRMLWGENVKSVAYRYPNDGPSDRPGPIDFHDADVLTYVYENPGIKLTVAEAFKLIGGYEYQSCEHDEWETSDAYALCQSLSANLVSYVPGYEAAPWGWDKDTLAERKGLTTKL